MPFVEFVHSIGLKYFDNFSYNKSGRPDRRTRSKDSTRCPLAGCGRAVAPHDSCHRPAMERDHRTHESRVEIDKLGFSVRPKGSTDC